MGLLQELIEGARQLGLDASRIQKNRNRWGLYLRLLREWGQRVALVSRRDLWSGGLVDHLLDSLALVPHLPEKSKVIDLGSGAGFPGVPLALYRPDLHVHLVESKVRKGVFLKTVKRELRLRNVWVHIERWENLEGVQGDVVVSRATGALNEILALAPKFLPKGGKILVYAVQKDQVLPPFAAYQVQNPRNRKKFYILEYRYRP